MDIQLTEEQRLLQETAARFCENEIPMTKVREMADDPKGLSDDLWRLIADQGWLGIMIPEKWGGLGLGVTEMGIVLEQTGRALVPGPFFSTAVLAAPAIALGGSDALKSAWLERIATGEVKATLALLEEDAQLGPSHVQARAESKDGGYVLTGKKFFVPDLMAAGVVVVAARSGEGDGENGVSLFLVETGAEGASVEENKLTDLTSRSGQFVLDGVKVGADALLGTAGQGWSIADQVLLMANVGIAAESVTGAEFVLKMAVDYAKERTQFGRPIGTFQAVKHPLANLFAEIESARSAYHYAAWAVDASSPDVHSAVAVARLTSTEAYRRATLDGLQAHGGIGFTWEYDLHLYLKRAKHNQYLLGEPADYEEIIAAHALAI